MPSTEITPNLSYPAFFLQARDVAEFRAELKTYFLHTYLGYEQLFEVIKSDASYYERPCSLRHPLIFYFGHTATFFMNKLVLAKLVTRVDPELESMFAIGVDEMSWDDLNEANYNWPTVDRVRAYRRRVKEALLALIDRVDVQFPITWQSPVWPILMGIEHERIHLETSSVLIRQLPFDQVQAHSAFPICPDQTGQPPANHWVDVSAGAVVIDHQDPVNLYGWDNEYGQHRAQVGEFKAGAMLVSNAEFLTFVQAGGYQSHHHWTEEGQGWLNFTKAAYPTFWLKKGDDFYLRTMTHEIPMPWSWPVEVNYLEAKAFCNWKAEQTGEPIRLPSEDEYLRLRDVCALPQTETAIGLQANLNLSQYASSTPVNANFFGEVYDVVGNVWQWTETPIYPFEGFKVHPLYDDFTTPTFDNKHNIFKGGSWISTGNEANLHSRYAFRRHFFQHAGFRYIASVHPVITQFDPYETETDVVQACELHYGRTYFNQQTYPQALAEQVRMLPKAGRFLELGCSVGQTCLQLAEHFEQLTGLDTTARLIQVAHQMQTQGRVRYRLSIEGEIPDFIEQNLPSFSAETFAHIQFLQQDPNNLKPIFTGYDVILLNQIIERLAHPAQWLENIHSRLNQAGILVVASHYGVDPKRTLNADRLGGFKQDGENVSSEGRLQEILSANFVPLKDPIDLPMVLRSDARHFEIKLVQVSMWQKR